MKKKIVTSLCIVGFSCGIIATGFENSSTWWHDVRPFFATFVITLCLAAAITYFNEIRRITYPALVCASAWMYNHSVIMSRFTRNAYRIYKMNVYSYSRLFTYTQNLFDIMYMED